MSDEYDATPTSPNSKILITKKSKKIKKKFTKSRQETEVTRRKMLLTKFKLL